MTLLIVDDQQAIVDSLYRDIDWRGMGFDFVATATSAQEARLLMRNITVDILLTDIEMPEEDGLALFSRAKQEQPDLIGVFLTSHADFTYAKKAISLGGFDYILQPARYEEIEQVVKKAISQLNQIDRTHRMEKTTRLIPEQIRWMLHLLQVNLKEDKAAENKELFGHIRKYFETELPDCTFWVMEIKIQYFEKLSNNWSEKLLCMVFSNILEEVFASEGVRICVSASSIREYLVLAAENGRRLDLDAWGQGIGTFTEFVNRHMGFETAVLAERMSFQQYRHEAFSRLQKAAEELPREQRGVLWSEDEEDRREDDGNEERMKQAAVYIRLHLGQPVSRTEVAEMLHLNEEYFSRLFRKYTGCTFKDYLIEERMKQAKKLLEFSNFPISVIAVKVGYVNFSYFSRHFKNMVGVSPQEYRAEKKAGK